MTRPRSPTDGILENALASIHEARIASLNGGPDAYALKTDAEWIAFYRAHAEREFADGDLVLSAALMCLVDKLERLQERKGAA